MRRVSRTSLSLKPGEIAFCLLISVRNLRWKASSAPFLPPVGTRWRVCHRPIRRSHILFPKRLTSGGESPSPLPLPRSFHQELLARGKEAEWGLGEISPWLRLTGSSGLRTLDAVSSNQQSSLLLASLLPASCRSSIYHPPNHHHPLLKRSHHLLMGCGFDHFPGLSLLGWTRNHDGLSTLLIREKYVPR